MAIHLILIGYLEICNIYLVDIRILINYLELYNIKGKKMIIEIGETYYRKEIPIIAWNKEYHIVWAKSRNWSGSEEKKSGKNPSKGFMWLENGEIKVF